MALHAFPKRKQHAILHEQIIESLNELIKKIPTMKMTEFEREMAHFVDVGLIKHFLFQDMQIHEWIEKRKRYRDANVWRESYMTGNGVFDAKHKALFDHLITLYAEGSPIRERC
jgi:hemerythrin